MESFIPKAIDYWIWHCPKEECGDQLLMQSSCAKLDDDRYLVICRCPNCDTPSRGVFPLELQSVYEEENEMAQDEIAMALAELREEKVQSFLTALDLNKILPEDF